MEGVLRDVIDSHAHTEEGAEDEIVGAERGFRRIVLVDVVGAEAGRALGKFLNRGHRQGADDNRIGLFAGIHHPGELRPIFAFGRVASSVTINKSRENRGSTVWVKPVSGG